MTTHKKPLIGKSQERENADSVEGVLVLSFHPEKMWQVSGWGR
jgi:hypothetical protein